MRKKISKKVIFKGSLPSPLIRGHNFEISLDGFPALEHTYGSKTRV